MTHMWSHIKQLEEGRLKYRPNGLLLLLPIDFRMEPHQFIYSQLSSYAGLNVYKLINELIINNTNFDIKCNLVIL